MELSRWYQEIECSPSTDLQIRKFYTGGCLVGKILQIIHMLEEFGRDLPFPYSSQIEGKMPELRAHYGKTHYRLLYYGDVRRGFILLHAFTKRTERIPEKEKRIARQRLQADEQRKKGKTR